MTEIKFRAWDEQRKVMHNNFQFIKSGDSGSDWIVFTSDLQQLNSVVHPFDNPYFSQQLKITQSTSLLDKSKSEVFQGDILNCGGQTGVVVKDPKEARFAIRFKGESELYALIKGAVKFYEVIGNVYQNPELWGGEHD